MMFVLSCLAIMYLKDHLFTFIYCTPRPARRATFLLGNDIAVDL